MNTNNVPLSRLTILRFTQNWNCSCVRAWTMSVGIMWNKELKWPERCRFEAPLVALTRQKDVGACYRVDRHRLVNVTRPGPRQMAIGHARWPNGRRHRHKLGSHIWPNVGWVFITGRRGGGRNGVRIIATTFSLLLVARFRCRLSRWFTVVNSSTQI